MQLSGLSFRMVASSCWLAEDDNTNQKPAFFVQYVDAIYSMCNSLITGRDTSSLVWCTACATRLELVAYSYIGNSESNVVLQVLFWIRKKIKLVGLLSLLGVGWSLPSYGVRWMHFSGEGEKAEKSTNVHLSNTAREEGKASDANGAQEASFLFLSFT